MEIAKTFWIVWTIWDAKASTISSETFMLEVVYLQREKFQFSLKWVCNFCRLHNSSIWLRKAKVKHVSEKVSSGFFESFFIEFGLEENMQDASSVSSYAHASMYNCNVKCLKIAYIEITHGDTWKVPGFVPFFAIPDISQNTGPPKCVLGTEECVEDDELHHNVHNV